jgi:8-oxo-dGTP diphosphatase
LQKTNIMAPNHTFCYEYPRPALTADCVLFSFENNQLQVLLIERKHEPFKGMWAFPGGFMDMDETIDECVSRELKEETGLENITAEQIGVFSNVDRDPRGRTVTVAYLAMARQNECHAVAGDDAQNVQWFPVDALPLLAFDHDKILDTAMNRLSEKMKLAPMGSELLPEYFTKDQLNGLYNAIAGHGADIDKLLNERILIASNEEHQMYRFSV